MRRVAVALAIAGAWLLAPISAYSDTDLTGLVNTTFLTRTEDAGLHDIAHQRAVEISTDFSHAGRRDGTAEVLAYNGLGAARAVEQWLGSPDHLAILSDPTYTLIGCGSHVVVSAYYAVCVLKAGEPVEVARTPNPTPVGAMPTAGASPVLLPNTAITHGDGADREER